MIRYFFVTFLLLNFVSRAEYRVFELEITTYAEDKTEEVPVLGPDGNKVPPEELGNTVVISNLDPQQYRYYHTVLPNQRVRYVSTWRCFGRTDNKDYCPNPKVKTEDVSSATPLETK